MQDNEFPVTPENSCYGFEKLGENSMFDAEKIKATMQEAVDNLKSGQLAKAAQACETLLADNPRYGDASHLLGVIKQQMGEPQEAIKLLKHALSIDNGAARYHSTLGALYAGTEDYKKARESLASSLMINPNDLETLYNQGLACLNMGDAKVAVEVFRRTVKIAPKAPQLLTILGVSCHATGDYGSAISAYRKALKLDTKNPEIFYNLGLSLLRQKNNIEALKAFENAVKILPDFEQALKHINDLKNPEEAQKETDT